MPPGNRALTTHLTTLAIALRARYQRTGDQADLDAAIDASKRAVAASPADDPDQAGRLFNLGGVIIARYDRERDPADLTAALDSWRLAGLQRTGTPESRLKASWRD